MENSVIEKIKELVKRGNVSRILVKKGDKILVDVPVTVGVLGGVAMLAVSKVLLIAGVLATVGYGCVVEVIKDDGEVVDVLNEESGRKARAAAQGVVNDIKNTFNRDKSEADDFEQTVAADEPAEEETTGE